MTALDVKERKRETEDGLRHGTRSVVRGSSGIPRVCSWDGL